MFNSNNERLQLIQASIFKLFSIQIGKAGFWFQLFEVCVTEFLNTLTLLVLTAHKSDSYQMENEFSDAAWSASVPYETHSD